MKILCLSRAPLDFRGGIPAYCLNLYLNKDFDVTNYSYDLSKKLKKVNVRNIKNIKEIVYPSQLVLGTIAISLQYFISILKNSYKYEFIHVQHPDPFSGISVIFAKILNPKIKIIVTWHADIYSSYFFIAPLLFLIYNILIHL